VAAKSAEAGTLRFDVQSDPDTCGHPSSLEKRARRLRALRPLFPMTFPAPVFATRSLIVAASGVSSWAVIGRNLQRILAQFPGAGQLHPAAGRP
jgi:hypothetical protein